jgi:hypothetical protein
MAACPAAANTTAVRSGLPSSRESEDNLRSLMPEAPAISPGDRAARNRNGICVHGVGNGTRHVHRRLGIDVFGM